MSLIFVWLVAGMQVSEECIQVDVQAVQVMVLWEMLHMYVNETKTISLWSTLLNC